MFSFKHAHIFLCVSPVCRITKPLTFADCVGDELPLGWEVVYDQQIGVYYIDHINSEFNSCTSPFLHAIWFVHKGIQFGPAPLLCGVFLINSSY